MKKLRKIQVVLFIVLFFINYGQGQSLFFKPVLSNSDIENKQLNCIFQDHLGFIWLGTDDGLYSFDGHELSPVNLPDSTSENQVTAIFEDHKHVMWLGFLDGTILQYVGFDKFIHVSNHSVTSKITTFIDNSYYFHLKIDSCPLFDLRNSLSIEQKYDFVMELSKEKVAIMLTKHESCFDKRLTRELGQE